MPLCFEEQDFNRVKCNPPESLIAEMEEFERVFHLFFFVVEAPNADGVPGTGQIQQEQIQLLKQIWLLI